MISMQNMCFSVNLSILFSQQTLQWIL
jgi:hypothetical protein